MFCQTIIFGCVFLRNIDHMMFTDFVLLQARELIKKSDRHRVTEVEHLVDPTIFELPNHTVSVTDLADVDLGGLNGLGLGLNHGMLGNRKVCAV